MRKALILLSLLATAAIAEAQIRYIYIPGDGERQFGFSIAPSFASQHLKVTATNYDVVGSMDNLIGINAGIFYGYETQHGNTIEWGNYTALYYSINPYIGEVTMTNKKTQEVEKHKMSFAAQHVILQINPFLAFRINEQFSVSAGIGFNIAPQIESKVRVDGRAMENTKSTEDKWLMNILNINFDANVGMKYWLSDEWFVGGRLHYSFANLLSLINKNNEDDDDALDFNGSVNYNKEKETARCVLLSKNAFQLVCSIGYTW